MATTLGCQVLLSGGSMSAPWMDGSDGSSTGGGGEAAGPFSSSSSAHSAVRVTSGACHVLHLLCWFRETETALM